MAARRCWGGPPQAPAELLVSIEADVFSLRDPADSDLIDGAFKEFVFGQLGALPELRTIVTFMSQTFCFGLKRDAII